MSVRARMASSGRRALPSLFLALTLTLAPILVALWLQWTLIALVLAVHRVILVIMAALPSAGRSLALAPVAPLQPPDWADDGATAEIDRFDVGSARLLMIPIPDAQAFALGSSRAVDVYLTYGAIATLDDDERRAVIERLIAGAGRGEPARRARALVMARGVRALILGRFGVTSGILRSLDRVFALNSGLWQAALLPRTLETDNDQVAVREGVDAQSLASALRVCAAQASLGEPTSQARSIDVIAIARSTRVEAGALAPVRMGRAPIMERASRLDALAGNHRHRHEVPPHDLAPLAAIRPDVAPAGPPADPGATLPPPADPPEPQELPRGASPALEMGVESDALTHAALTPGAIDADELLGDAPRPRRGLFGRRRGVEEIDSPEEDAASPDAGWVEPINLPPATPLPPVEIPMDEAVVLTADPAPRPSRPRRWGRRRKEDATAAHVPVSDVIPVDPIDLPPPAVSVLPLPAEVLPLDGDVGITMDDIPEDALRTSPDAFASDESPGVISADELLAPRPRRRLFGRRRATTPDPPDAASPAEGGSTLAALDDGGDREIDPPPAWDDPLPPELPGQEDAVPELPADDTAPDLGFLPPPLPGDAPDPMPSVFDAHIAGDLPRAPVVDDHIHEDAVASKASDVTAAVPDAAGPPPRRSRRRLFGRRDRSPVAVDEARPGIPLSAELPPPVPVVADPGAVQASGLDGRSLEHVDAVIPPGPDDVGAGVPAEEVIPAAHAADADGSTPGVDAEASAPSDLAAHAPPTAELPTPQGAVASTLSPAPDDVAMTAAPLPVSPQVPADDPPPAVADRDEDGAPPFVPAVAPATAPDTAPSADVAPPSRAPAAPLVVAETPPLVAEPAPDASEDAPPAVPEPEADSPPALADEAPPVIEPLPVGDGPRRIRYTDPIPVTAATPVEDAPDAVEEFVPVFRDPLGEIFRRGRRGR